MVAAVIKCDERALGIRLTVSTICTGDDDSILATRLIIPRLRCKTILDRDLVCDRDVTSMVRLQWVNWFIARRPLPNGMKMFMTGVPC